MDRKQYEKEQEFKRQQGGLKTETYQRGTIFDRCGTIVDKLDLINDAATSIESRLLGPTVGPNSGGMNNPSNSVTCVEYLISRMEDRIKEIEETLKHISDEL
jgi:hypothetical protein